MKSGTWIVVPFSSTASFQALNSWECSARPVVVTFISTIRGVITRTGWGPPG